MNDRTGPKHRNFYIETGDGMNKAACVHIDVLFEQKYDLLRQTDLEVEQNQVDKELAEAKSGSNEFQELERFFDKINDFYNPLAVLKDRSLKQLNCPLCIDCFNEPIRDGGIENNTMTSRFPFFNEILALTVVG